MRINLTGAAARELQARGWRQRFDAEQVVSAASAGAECVILADIDGDGDLDMVVAAAGDNTVAWFANTDGGGTYGPAQIVTTTASGVQMVVAEDIDGDGDLDLAVASNGDHTLAWFANTNGSGDFGPAQIVTSTASGASVVAAADMDGDGDVDLIVGALDEGAASWFPNTDGAGTFGLGNVIATSVNLPRTVTPVDIDDDGDIDIVIGSGSTFSAKALSWYSNDGTGSFSSARTVRSVSATPTAVTAADIDGDGDWDLAVGLVETGETVWYRNLDGAGAFAAARTISTTANYVTDIVAVDMDGDGDLDIATASKNDNTVAWRENTDGFGSFGPEILVTASASGAASVAAGDIDGNGAIDFAVASATANTVGWFRNAMYWHMYARTPVVVTSAAPGAASVAAGDFNGDGAVDLASISSNDRKVAWYAGDGSGSFGAQTVIDTNGGGAEQVIAVDVDGDGDSDVVAISTGGGYARWYANTDSAGTFGPALDIATTDVPYGAAVADLDGDADVDLAIVFRGHLAWLANTDGAGNFGTAVTISTFLLSGSAVIAADIDGDGDSDLVTTSQLDRKVAWYENTNGAGAFGVQNVITSSAYGACSVVAADIDGDGDLDLASTSQFDDKVAWYDNTDGAGAFGPLTLISSLASAPVAVVALDADSDGDVDLAVVSAIDNYVRLFQNNGDGSSFAIVPITSAASEPEGLAAVDIDADGDSDLVVANSGATTVTYFANIGPAPPPSPPSPPAGPGGNATASAAGTVRGSSSASDDDTMLIIGASAGAAVVACCLAAVVAVVVVRRRRGGQKADGGEVGSELGRGGSEVALSQI
ncbi:fibronectin type III domain-containing protein [Thecamonas trahens ATCC 50062]|uniref:Fibronectin type III domain-containing protein n=1 Tax=Thecamonas trahens ATCC 50062 TaxID=461836 RepID=A0A0L0DPD4_THETB|nr:fibronectin type III domain-containing protein [Thecamonas trahens ATCC 50062]KNC54164.1 fibronectin type III domain-containing protein [Thecamonas trahens ATCC 50062]|eukprot:XP_013753982.1 fibronectin type III domain-containing protein [Thecamonas trahens ATCC 50062]